MASLVTKREYPYLEEKEIQEIDEKTYVEIKKNVVAMIFHKVGGIVRDATDNLFLSKYISLAISGVYSNYSMITRALTTLITQIFSSVLSGVGNLHVTADEASQREVFYNINYINFWLASFCTCCFGVLSNAFILEIADETYLLDNVIVILVSIRFYLDIMRKTPWMFCEAAGIYWKGKSKPIWEAVVNLIISLILVKIIGMPGIFIGTIVTIIIVDLPMEPYLVFKYVLKGGLIKYYFRYVFYLIIAILMYIASYFACSLITDVRNTKFHFKGNNSYGGF